MPTFRINRAVRGADTHIVEAENSAEAWLIAERLPFLPEANNVAINIDNATDLHTHCAECGELLGDAPTRVPQCPDCYIKINADFFSDIPKEEANDVL